MLRPLVISLLITTTLTSCNLLPHKESNQQKAVARVYDKYLYQDDLAGVIPAGTNADDSIEITAAYINNWIRQELLLKQAEDNLAETNRDFTDQIEQYRNTLIIYAYESELVKQKLDTVVPMAEIEDYYLKNQANFLLHENIVQASYVILDKKSRVAAKVKTLLQSSREADKEKLQALCEENEADFMINNESWMSFSDLARKIPLEVDDQQEFLSKYKFFEVADSTNLYFVAISAYKGKESISPMNFKSEDIRTLLLNKRKAELLKQMEADLISDAVKRKKYEIFKK